MTNTKFRKRALLSSVAMLLVALVALGSATFAWFTNNPVATAEGLKVHTSTSAGLVAKAASDTRGFSHSTILNFDAAAYSADETVQTVQTSTDIQPASFDPTVVAADGQLTFKSFTAADPSAYGKNTAAAQAGAAWSEIVYLKTTDNAAAGSTIKLGSVKVDIDEASGSSTNAALAGCLRVAVTTSTGKLIGVWQANGAAAGNATAFSYFDNTTGGVTTGYTFKADGDTVAIAAADQMTVTSSTSDNYVRVYVYLDGEDYNCVSEDVVDAGALLGAQGVKLTFTAA